MDEPVAESPRLNSTRKPLASDARTSYLSIPRNDKYHPLHRTADSGRRRGAVAARLRDRPPGWPSAYPEQSRRRERALADSAPSRAVVDAAGRNFGRRLRDHRERHQITLDTIASATKIKPSVLAELERGEVSTWPSGIFRRALVRGYATAVGLPPESLVNEFVRLFPERDAADRAASAMPTSDLRLTLEVDRRELMVATAIRAAAALADVGLIVAVAGFTAWIEAASFWSACAAIALVYYALATACIGRSPASWYLQGGLRAPWRRRRAGRTSVSSDTREQIYLVPRLKERPREPVQEDPAGPASTPPLRAASR
jgi:transcriptional regulator with XRE-family HTH domain